MYLSKFCTSINEDGSLRITVHNEFYSSIAHVKSWKDGLGMTLIQGKREHFDFINRESTLLNKAHNKSMGLPIHEFIKEIPVIYIEAIKEYIFLQHLALRVFRYYPRAYELYNSNKYLFDLVLYNHQDLRKTGSLISLKQHEIIKALYPNKKCSISYKSVERLVRKNIIPTIDPGSMHIIDSLMRKIIYSKLNIRSEKSLLHIKYIPLCYLEDKYINYVFRFRKSVLFKQIEDYLLASGNDYDLYSSNNFIKQKIIAFNSLIEDIKRMSERLGVPSNEVENKLFDSKDENEINRYHDDLLDEIGVGGGEEIVFGKPPIPGTNEIIPITSSTGLLIEGDELNHCVGHAGYEDFVISGESYIYAIKTDSDRCTLELGIKDESNYFIKQLSGNGNVHPKRETRKLVNNWLKEATKYQ